jgi:hypothetical protein
MEIKIENINIFSLPIKIKTNTLTIPATAKGNFDRHCFHCSISSTINNAVSANDSPVQSNEVKKLPKHAPNTPPAIQ